jgi:hypothetical protein
MSAQLPASHNTVRMTVANMGQLLERIGGDCAPLQFVRELTENAIQAIEALPGKSGEIVWDIDAASTLNGRRKLAIIDTGIGMSGPEMVDYINQLSSSMHDIALDENYGIGAKIAAATRNHQGLVYLSWKEGQGAMIHLWKDPQTLDYGLRRLALPDGRYESWAPVEDSLKPPQIADHGTVVILLGNQENEDTAQAPAEAAVPSHWIARYLNTRYFRFPEGVTVRARDFEEKAGLRTVTGMQDWFTRYSSQHGSVTLSAATAHWWILDDRGGVKGPSAYVEGGHVAALFGDEIYEMTNQGRASYATLSSFGVIFGQSRVVIYVEPRSAPGYMVRTNAARTHLIINRQPLPWADWASEFRSKMPAEIRSMMEEISSNAETKDHKQSIRERLKPLRDLFKLSRYRPADDGEMNTDPESRTTGGKVRPRALPVPSNEDAPRVPRVPREIERRSGNAGDVFTLFVTTRGQRSEEVTSDDYPSVSWISRAAKTREDTFLDDRAAQYLQGQNLIQINADFRVFRDMVKRWTEAYREMPGAERVIEDEMREWFEQALVEVVLGVRALRGSVLWTGDDINRALSSEALTAAVLQRYHVDMALRRSLGTKLGSLKDRIA